MNTLKTIYDKLGDKTELAKHEVELGLLDEANILNKELIALSLNTRTTLSEFLKFKTKLLDDKTKINNLYKALDISETRLIKAESELGISIPNLRQYQITLKDANDIIKAIISNTK